LTPSASDQAVRGPKAGVPCGAGYLGSGIHLEQLGEIEVLQSAETPSNW
jgi:hypothetical protein